MSAKDEGVAMTGRARDAFIKSLTAALPQGAEATVVINGLWFIVHGESGLTEPITGDYFAGYDAGLGAADASAKAVLFEARRQCKKITGGEKHNSLYDSLAASIEKRVAAAKRAGPSSELFRQHRAKMGEKL